jgi:hypothetical protein
VESARRFFEVEQEVEFLVQVEEGLVVRMAPVDGSTPTNAERG